MPKSYKDIMYSDWLKIDLHIHTDYSRKTKTNDYKGRFSVSTLKEKLQFNNVDIFSLTDHNIFNVDAYKEYYSSFIINEAPLLLPGIELDLVVTIKGQSKRYHTLLIFRESTIDKVVQLNEKLENKYIELEISDPCARKLTIENVVDCFYNEDFFFIPHANNHDTSIVEAYKKNIRDAQKMVLLMPSALEKVKAESIHIYNKYFDSHLTESFRNKNDIAYLNFSDNHNIEKYPCIHMGDYGDHDFYYIKGNRSYETIRLAFIDPTSRVASPERYESIRNPENYIEMLDITDDSFIEDTHLSFSPHMNVIIGGRSSGKSLLHNIFGHKIDKINASDKYKNKVDFDCVKIKSKIDHCFQDVTSLSDELIYIDQGDIVEYFEKKDLKALSDNLNCEEKYQVVLTNFREHKRNFESHVELLIDAYGSAFDEIANEHYILHLSTIDKILSRDCIFKIATDNLNQNYDKRDKLRASIQSIRTMQVDIEDMVKNELVEFNDSETKIIDAFSKLLENKKNTLKEQMVNTKRIVSFINDIDQLIAVQNGALSREAKEKGNANSIVSQLLENIDSHFKHLACFNYRCNELENFNYAKQEKLILNSEVNIVVEIESQVKIKDLIIDGINNGDISKSIYQNLLSLLKNENRLKHHPNNNKESLSKKINKQLSELIDYCDQPTDYLEYKDGNTSKDNSPGYNSEKYLEVILSNPQKKYIFIDQPEDNLGNQFITEKLVSLLREQKFNKQIFLVTHNPSIVVYGDAESIIISKNTSNHISYKQIVLEDQDAQKEICGILDGGEYIFHNRSRKYNITRILKRDEDHV